VAQTLPPEERQDTRLAIASGVPAEPAAPFFERPPDGFGLRFASEARDLGSETLDFRILQVQSHGLHHGIPLMV
jgi:hypothetical protein